MSRCNIIVSAGACRTSGARTIYLQFLKHLKKYAAKNHYYIFIDEGMPQEDIPGVEYILENVRNGYRRVIFDYYNCKRILKQKQIAPDIVVSLQNTGVACLKEVPQIIYYHQPLPLYPQKWNPLKPDERTLAFYKYAYPYFVRDSYKKGRVDFVAQIPFIKDGIVKRFKIDASRVHTLFPDVDRINMEEVGHYHFDGNTYNWVYPAASWKYKNHRFLADVVDAIRWLHPEMMEKVRIHLTLSRSENKGLELLLREKGVSSCFVFHGAIPHEELLAMLNASHGMLFPSQIETLGLPLLEAAGMGKGIITADLPYSHQVLGDYPGSVFLDVNDPDAWAEMLHSLSKGKPRHFKPMPVPEKSSWDSFFELID